MPRSRFLDVFDLRVQRAIVLFGPVGIHDHSFDPRYRRFAISVVRWRLHSWLAEAAVQYDLCRGDPDARRCIGADHDFGQRVDRGHAVRAGQFCDVYFDICFICLHENKVAILMTWINRVARRGRNYKKT